MPLEATETASIRNVMRLAVPAVLSNVAVPLLGLVDITIVGHLNSASYIGAIAVGTMMFNLIYWLFGFLRMSTGGFTAQALGQNDQQSIIFVLFRALLTGLIGAGLLLLLQRPIGQLGMRLIGASPEVESFALRYYHILIWGAPAVLCLYGLNGWFLGMQNARFPMYITIFQSLSNIGLSLLMVYGLKMQIEGVAYGTLAAQYLGLLMASCLWYARYGRRKSTIRFAQIGWLKCFLHDGMHLAQWRTFLRVNRDLFLRTLCLIFVTLYFTHVGACQGDTLLAANTLLMQFFTLYSYFIDGFAYAGEAICGLCFGRKDYVTLHHGVRNVLIVGLTLTACFILLYALAGTQILALLTDHTAVARQAADYLPWVVFVPLCGMYAFLFDGIFSGATASMQMLLSLLAGTIVFFTLQTMLFETMANHALWLAFDAYLLTRGLVLRLSWPSLLKRIR